MSKYELRPSDQDQQAPWEEAAQEAVHNAIESSEFDEVETIIKVPDCSGDSRMAHYCHSLEEYRLVLEELYDQRWCSHVPFDGGKPLFEGDASGYVADVLDEDKIEAFFSQFEEKPEGELIISAADLLRVGASKVVRVDLEAVNDQLISHLAMHPEKMRELHPRKFEELVAELFESKGYNVTLTPQTRDGGADLYAVRRDELGTVLVLIECKRYAADKKVGVEVVRGLYGLVGKKQATKGLVATTSYFSKDAKKFHNDVKYQLELTDYDKLCSMLTEWKTNNR